MQLLRRLADNTQPNSLATAARRKRFSFFLQLLNTLPRPIRILDVGGTREFWNNMGFTTSPDIHVTLLNLDASPIEEPGFSAVIGDARQMPHFRDGEFDVVFSNSVIEHVGKRADQQKMADELRRVGQRYFVQTPNYWFPLEPHFLFPGFQFLPVTARVYLVTHFRLGWQPRYANRTEAQQVIETTVLLTQKELRQLFPDAQVYQERFMGLTKSLVVYGGWANMPHAPK